ncbi:hypothetical protein MG290_02670 [Flavobacterium sp. CBA20B-1]|uniref:hypothetical protein n=1 Tax=Flavobacterium sp. CBA20B-1 TaxID=2918454 RepID=UPI00234914BF|nr:hypothetical protein [Flavobacterium sp. CBA20B-1]WCM42595.1 hypothetical protein MG290_02670 [Flavobacterium sp. CBA20B-1]
MLKLFVVIPFLFISCSEKNINNPDEVYELWLGEKPLENINPINGNYWQSAHFTNEYILFLEVEAHKKFWEVFVKEHNLIVDTLDNSFLISDKPDWFHPPKNTIKYKINDSFDQGSRYFQDTINDKIYIYEIQL